MKKKCKVSDNWNASECKGEHTFNYIPVAHTQDAIKVMQEIGTAAPAPSDHPEGKELEFIPLVDWLDPTKHIPPSHGDEGIISPVIGFLVAINPNSDNCQLTNGYFISRYLAKYISKMDEYGRIYIQPPKSLKDPGAFNLDGKTMLNTKITSNNIHQNETKPTRGKSEKTTKGLAINIADVYLKVFGYPTILTNYRTVKIATDTYENRAARERKRKPIDRIRDEYQGPQTQALTPLNTLPAHHARKVCGALARWRQFTHTQVNKMFDDLFSPLCPDPVTKFGFRPPELRCIMHQAKYHRWFKEMPLVGTKSNRNGEQIKFIPIKLPDLIDHCVKALSSSNDLTETEWIAGNSKLLKVRAAAIDEIIPYIQAAPLAVFHTSNNIAAQHIKNATLRLFVDIQHAHSWINHGIIPHGPDTGQPLPLHKGRYETICGRFVCEAEYERLPTVWMNQVKPSQPQRFLIHLLLSFGAFIDEYDLFSCGSLRWSFVRARLLDPTSPEESAKKLMTKYFFLQLKYLPSGTPTFDRHTTSARDTIYTFFLQQRIHSDEFPSVLYRRLKNETNEKVKSFALARQTNFVTRLLQNLTDAGIGPLPTLEQCLTATIEYPKPWDINQLQKPINQPAESFKEQSNLLLKGKQQIDLYVDASNKLTPQSQCIVGAGGVGKTTCGLIITLYARTVGCTINGTTLMSERAQELGIEHWNKDLCVPVSNLYETTPGQLAEKMLASLYRQPERMEFHRTCDVNFIDEMGPIPAEYWSARDIVLRHITGSSRPNGGSLDIVTFDHLQVHPVQGTHPLVSPFIASTYNFKRLYHSVRAAAHQGWRRMQEITRMTPTELDSPVIEKEWISLFTKYCSSVREASQVPRDALFVYGKNGPIRMHQNKVIQRLRGQPGVIFSHSIDLERNFQGRYTEGGKTAALNLNRRIREQDTIPLFKKARYRVTFNNHPFHSNGQIAFLDKLPSNESVTNKQPIEFLVSPAGSTYLPGEDDNEETLVEKRGWTKTKIGLAPDRIAFCNGCRYKRTKQYGIQLHVASTFHSTLGKTLAKLACRIDSMNDKDSPYSIWDPTQVVIMMSRTKLPSQTIFVTDDMVATATAIYKVLKRTSAFQRYLSDLLHNLCRDGSSSHPVHIDNAISIYRPRDISLPPQPTGYVYLLVSTVDTDHIYIGSCRCLITRFNQHNRGFGSMQTAPASLRPWGLLGYICGFQGHEDLWKELENAWIVGKEDVLKRKKGHATLHCVIELVDPLLTKYNKLHQHTSIALRYFDCGTVTTLESSSTQEDQFEPIHGFLDQDIQSQHDQFQPALHECGGEEEEEEEDFHGATDMDIDSDSCCTMSTSDSESQHCSDSDSD